MHNARVPDANHEEWITLQTTAGWRDVSDRSRLCLLGDDRAAFLHGQVTNDIKALAEHAGCYAAIVSAKGKMESDLFVYRLADELLLDFEPGLTGAVITRLENFIIAEDVEVADAAPHFSQLTVQGPTAGAVLAALGLPTPGEPLAVEKTGNEIFVINQPRLGTCGFDLFVPVAEVDAIKAQLETHAPECGKAAFEKARVLATIPRFGVDFDESNLAPEAGIEARAISYAKGCYIGQEIIARIRTYGKVNRILRGLRLDQPVAAGAELMLGDKEVGQLTSVTTEPNSALAIVHRDAAELGTELKAGIANATVASLPFEAIAL